MCQQQKVSAILNKKEPFLNPTRGRLLLTLAEEHAFFKEEIE